MDFNKLSLEMHEENKGKLEVVSKVRVETKDDLSTAYTPGVAEPCRKINENPMDAYEYTCKLKDNLYRTAYLQPNQVRSAWSLILRL